MELSVESNKNIFTSITIVMLVLFIAMIINITINLGDFGFNSAKTKAELVAESVKNGLTAHMVNGMMQNIDFFLNQTKNLENIDDLWIVRSDAVIKQYGDGKEYPRDDIDKQVLKKGITIEDINENFMARSSYRITIPYKAEQTKQIDCLSCHEAKIGETLGVISMVITIDDLKLTGIKIITFTSAIAFVLMFSIIWYIKHLTAPYLSIFSSIKKVMQKAQSGDYSGRIENINSGEAKNVAHWINELMNKLQTSLNLIGEKIDVFLTAHKSSDINDPISDMENTVTRLADIYRFRKTIETYFYSKL